MDFWTRVSRIIIKGRFLILILLGLATYFMTTQWQYMRFSYTEANLMPKDHEVNLEYDKFLEYFGEEGNVIVIGVKDSTIFTPEKFNNWNNLAKKVDSFPEIDYTIAIGDIKKLNRDDKNKKFITESLYDKKPTTKSDINNIKKDLFENLPFYDNILYNKETETLQTVIYIRKDVVNTSKRRDLISGKFNTLIKQFEGENNLDVRVSGMPYIRTMNAENIIAENENVCFISIECYCNNFLFLFPIFQSNLYYTFSSNGWSSLGLWVYWFV